MGIELPFTTLEMTGAFLLVFFRMTGLVIAAPLFSNQSFPMTLRVWFAFMLAAVMFPIAWNYLPSGALLAKLQHPWLSILAVGGEFAIGWIIGWAASVMIWAAQLAGHLVGQEIGMSIGEVFDPISQTQSSALSQLFFTFALLLFVILGGHHLVVMSVSQSFEAAPIGTFPIGAGTGKFLAQELGSDLWVMGVKTALPTMFALIFVTVAMAILARTVPEMNIFMIGFTLRIIFGLLALIVVLPFVADLFQSFLVNTQLNLERLLEMWEGG
ncbi:MAG: flagellar biosynthetic protein FliR [Planctomycetota bacterium]